MIKERLIVMVPSATSLIPEVSPHPPVKGMLSPPAWQPPIFIPVIYENVAKLAWSSERHCWKVTLEGGNGRDVWFNGPFVLEPYDE